MESRGGSTTSPGRPRDPDACRRSSSFTPLPLELGVPGGYMYKYAGNRGASQPGLLRASQARLQVIYKFGGYRLDTDRFELSRESQAVAAEPQVLELLILLIDNRDRVISRDELLEQIWRGRIVSDATVSSRIKTARQVIGDDGTRQTYIRTIHGRGFRFVGDVAIEPAADSTSTSVAAGRPAFDRPATRYARSGDIHIAYQLFGHGPVNLVLTPGFVSHIDNFWESPCFRRWLNRLGELAHVAIFDKRGTGLSDRVGSLPGMDKRMDDVRAVMDAARFDTAVIMGISEGGSLAALFAAHHPDRCDGLILYGAFARFRYWFPDEDSLQALFDYIESDWGTGKSLPQFAPSPADDPEFVRWWGQFERLGATPGAAIALMRMNSRIDISDVLPGIRIPTLVIHVADDVLIDVEAGRELAARIPGARYVELPGRDHLPFTENFDGTIDAIEGFLRRMTRGEEQPGRIVATIVLIRIHERERGPVTSADAKALKSEILRFRATRVSLEQADMLATFDGPARALECAVAVSRLLRAGGIDHRIGVHTGEIAVGNQTLAGAAMDIVADVADQALDNEILASRTVNDLIAGSGLTLQDRGAHRLPSINQDWHLFRVAT